MDPYSGMAYSYIPIGSTGEEYDHMASEVDDKLYFAGEVCIKLIAKVFWEMISLRQSLYSAHTFMCGETF